MCIHAVENILGQRKIAFFSRPNILEAVYGFPRDVDHKLLWQSGLGRKVDQLVLRDFGHFLCA